MMAWAEAGVSPDVAFTTADYPTRGAAKQNGAPRGPVSLGRLTALSDILLAHHAIEHGDGKQGIGARCEHGNASRRLLGVGVYGDNTQGFLLGGPNDEP